MNTGERLQTARKVRGMTQREVGLEMHYPYFSSDVRIAQYENNIRTPSDETVEKLAQVLKVSKSALVGPQGYTRSDVMRMLYEMEEQGYRIEIQRYKNQLVIVIHNDDLYDLLKEWRKVKNRLKAGRITQKDYLIWKLTWEE